jgi:deoxyribose-phosphate aldolase
VKTSTGYGREPTKVEHVRLVREVVGSRALVKASGGIRTAADAVALVEAGADILGTSDALALLGQAKLRS